MDGAEPAASGARVRLAYLCNLYPAVSHSFIRREIEAIERAGHEAHRFSLRPPRGDLRDEADLGEAARTECVLNRGALGLSIAALARMLRRPLKTIVALRTAFRLAGPGAASKLRHLVYWFEAAWLANRLEQLRVEHLHAHFGTNPAAVGAIVRAWGGPTFSFTVHGPDEFDAPIGLSLRPKIESARFVVAISSYGRSQLMRWTDRKDWKKLTIVRCGVDRSFIEAGVEPVSQDSVEFLCVARLSGQKGLPILIAAADRLRIAGKRLKVTIIGDGDLRQILEADIRQRGLEAHVHLVGVQSAAEIRDHLRRARTFVLPSFAEGLPVVLMEALALSRPVIATAIAGIPELVDDECGWLIPAGDEEALAEAMKQALQASVAELAAKGEVGRARVHRMHNADRNARFLIAALQDAPLTCVSPDS